MAVGVLRLLFLQVRAVPEQDLAQVAGGRRGVDRPPEPVAHQRRQPAAVVEVGMTDDHRVDAARGHRQGQTVAQAKLLVALEQAAIDHQALAVVLDEVLGPGDGASGTEKTEMNAHAAHVTPTGPRRHRAGPRPARAYRASDSSSMKMKPAISVTEAMPSKPLRCVSGMISWLTTNSMAPAATARPTG